jgi:general secretion pathway protein D
VKTEVTYLSLTYDHAIIFFAVFAITGVPTAFAQERTAPTLPTSSQERAGTTKDSNKQDLVTLNFTNIEISALVKVISELTHRNFLLDERVTGKITVMTPTKITPDEAYQVFLSALEIKGFTAIEDGAFVRIIPTGAARQSGLKVITDGEILGEGFVTKLVRLKFMNSLEVTRTLMPLLTKDGSLISYAATNSLIVTDSVHNIRKLESLIAALDVPAQEGKGKINVYYLRNADAEEISKALTSLIVRLSASTSAQAQQTAGASTILEGTVSVAADKATNALVIIGSPGDYDTIRSLIQKLDIPRRQVYVEAAIIEITLTKQNELGFEFQAYNTNGAIGGTNFGNIGNVIKSGPSALAELNGLNIGTVKGTYTYNGVEYLNVGTLLHALQSDSDVNVLSTPNIMTMDNQKAEIMAGENIPVITNQLQSASTGSSITTSVERKDVGVTLKLTPQITSDDNVRLDIYQEISAVTTVAGLDANVVGPSTTKRSVSTSVVVKDGETIVIGGLMRDNLNVSISKVPLLGDIPLLGWFFKYKTTKVEKTSLMIFITPYIIKNEADAEEVTKKKSKSQEEFRKEFRIEKKNVEPISQASPALSQQPEGRTGAVQKKDAGNALDPVAPDPPAAATKEDPR